MSSDEEFFDAKETFDQIQDFMTEKQEPQIEIVTESVAESMISEVPNPQSFEAISVRRSNKDSLEFSDLFIFQSVFISDYISITALKFSPDNRFLAVSGNNGQISIYEISREATLFLKDPPHSVFLPHNDTITDMCWLNSSISLLSSSLDCTVQISSLNDRQEFSTFRHPDGVLSLAYLDDICATGCADKIVRVWSISRAQVERYETVHEFPEALAFTSDRSLVVGLSSGECLILSFNLVIKKEISCKNRRGWLRKGRRVTGIDLIDNDLLLVTTNDSRIRLFETENWSIKQKYKGNKNKNSRIKASAFPETKHIICGSETGEIHIWNFFTTYAPIFNPKFTRKKAYKNSSFEYFKIKSSEAIALFAPFSIAQKRNIFHIILTAQEGRIYVLYNPF